MSPYESLGVDPGATLEEIKAAYRKACARSHPDVGGSAAEFRLIQEAWELLRDPERRQRYDKSGETCEAESVESIVASEVVSLLRATMSMGELPLLPMLNRQFKAEVDKAKELCRKGKAQISQLVSLSGRVRKVDGGRNVFEEVLQQQIDAIRGEISSLEAHAKRMGAVLEYLKTYKEVRKKPTATFFLSSARGPFRDAAEAAMAGYMEDELQ